MPIEFHCPGCGKLVRTPDSTAGRKGKCPHCATKVQIPNTSLVSSSPASSPSQPSPGGSPSSGLGPGGTIQFSCTRCRKTLSVPAASAGKKGKCPQCGAVMPIPTPSTHSASKQPAAKWKGEPKATAGGPMRFNCPSCGKSVQVPASAAGRRGQCPHCKSVLQIPSAGTPSSAGLEPLAPFGDGFGLEPLGSSGLTPLGDSSQTPLGGGLDDLFSDLPAVGGRVPDDPLGDGPLGGGPARSPFGAPAGQPLNPYASPMPAPYPHKPSSLARTGAHTAVMVCASLLICYAAGQILLTVFVAVVMGTRGPDANPFMPTLPPQMKQAEEEAFLRAFVIGQVVAMAVAAVIFLIILAGGIQMLRFKTRGLCMTACVLAMLPCNCPICFLGIGLGIWGLVMLSQRSVRTAFG